MSTPSSIGRQITIRHAIVDAIRRSSSLKSSSLCTTKIISIKKLHTNNHAQHRSRTHLLTPVKTLRMSDCGCSSTAASMSLPLTLVLLVSLLGIARTEVAVDATEGESRVRRDGYGGGYGGGYSGGYSSGCHCPYQYCDNNSDMLLYFSAGALLGLLFSMLQPQMMMMAAAGRGNQQQPEVGGGGFFANIPNALSQDIAPLAVDMVNVYSRSQKEPECGRRWLCEVTRASLKHGGLRARLTSMSSVAVSWFMKDMMPFMENLTEEDEESFDCALLGPKCRGFFQQTEET